MDITTTLGPLLIGTLIATLLSGANTLQTIVYFRLYPKDTIRIKAFVTVLWILDVTFTAFTWDSLWFFFIENFGKMPEFSTEHNPEFLPGVFVLAFITTLVAHMFYLNRIFSLSNQNIWITLPVLILSLCRVGSGIAVIAVSLNFQSLSQFLASSLQVQWVLFLSLFFTAATDLAITMTIIALLWVGRQQTISLSNVLDQLVLYTVEAGMLTAFTAIAVVIAWRAREHSLVFFAISLSLSKVYATTLLGSLNLRYQLRNTPNPQISQDWNMTNVGDSPTRSRGLSDMVFQCPTTMSQTTETDSLLTV